MNNEGDESCWFEKLGSKNQTGDVLQIIKLYCILSFKIILAKGLFSKVKVQISRCLFTEIKPCINIYFNDWGSTLV